VTVLLSDAVLTSGCPGSVAPAVGADLEAMHGAAEGLADDRAGRQWIALMRAHVVEHDSAPSSGAPDDETPATQCEAPD
jgi:hypothetical protein